MLNVRTQSFYAVQTLESVREALDAPPATLPKLSHVQSGSTPGREPRFGAGTLQHVPEGEVVVAVSIRRCDRRSTRRRLQVGFLINAGLQALRCKISTCVDSYVVVRRINCAFKACLNDSFCASQSCLEDSSCNLQPAVLAANTSGQQRQQNCSGMAHQTFQDILLSTLHVLCKLLTRLRCILHSKHTVQVLLHPGHSRVP